jgi:hypothetical protein
MIKRILLITIPLVAIFVLGVFIGTKIKTKTNSGQQDSFQAGWDAAQKRLEESGAVPKLKGVEVKTVSGTIQKIENDTLTVKVSNVLGALSKPELDNRIVQINNETKIYKLIPKDNTEFQKETEEFNNKLKEIKDGSAGDMQIPIPFKEEEIKLADLKVGQTITINSNEDLKEKQQFVATKISVQSESMSTSGQQVPAQNIAPENLPTPSASVAPTVQPQDLPALPAPVNNGDAAKNLPAPNLPAPSSSAPSLPNPTN